MVQFDCMLSRPLHSEPQIEQNTLSTPSDANAEIGDQSIE